MSKKAVKQEKVNKKDQILSLFVSGVTAVADLAMLTGSRPAYVASVLQDSGQQPDYFDLYTSTGQTMNVYSKFFAGKLGFKDEQTAAEGVKVIDNYYRGFGVAGDRAGQHHAMLMALTMFNRARWTGKGAEAEVYRRWLTDRLNEAAPGEPPGSSRRG